MGRPHYVDQAVHWILIKKNWLIAICSFWPGYLVGYFYSKFSRKSTVPSSSPRETSFQNRVFFLFRKWGSLAGKTVFVSSCASCCTSPTISYIVSIVLCWRRDKKRKLYMQFQHLRDDFAVKVMGLSQSSLFNFGSVSASSFNTSLI